MASLEDRLVAAFQRVAGVTGAPIDWAARLQAGLVPAAGLLAATKALPGILRFATDAEAYAGLQDAAAVTPKQLLATHLADDFSVLHAMAALLPAGSVVAVPEQLYAGNGGSIPVGVIGASLWIINAGQTASPLVPFTVNSVAYLTYAGFAAYQYSRLVFQPYRSMVWVQTATAPKVYDEYVWIGATTKWFIWRGTVTPSFTTPNQNYSSITAVTVNGLEASLGLGVNRSDGAALVSYSTLIILPATARPPAERVFGGGASVPNVGWYLANWALQTGGDCLLLASNIPAGYAPTVAEGSVTFKRVIPSV